MCYQGKCFGCIPVEQGCLVFAVISAIVTGLATLACFIFGILIAVGTIVTREAARQADFPWESAPPEAIVTVTGVIAGIITFFIGIASLIAFIFSILLCNGICKGRPGQVKAYFVYGMTITVLATLAAVGELAADGPIGIGVSTLLGCAVYCLFLVLVHQTYYKILEAAIFKDHVRLVET